MTPHAENCCGYAFNQTVEVLEHAGNAAWAGYFRGHPRMSTQHLIIWNKISGQEHWVLKENVRPANTDNDNNEKNGEQHMHGAQYNPDIDTREVIQGIATALITATDQFDTGIPLGDSTNEIAHIAYNDGDPEIWLRTKDANAPTDQRVYIVRVHRLLEATAEESALGVQATRNSYTNFRGLQGQADAVVTVAKSLEQDQNLALQAWYEQLDDEDRADYDRWRSGGYATKAEWKLVQ